VTAKMEEGWLRVPYEGNDVAKVYIGVARPGQASPPFDSIAKRPGAPGPPLPPGQARWVDAFLSYDLQGERVAQVRPNEMLGGIFGHVTVWLRTNFGVRDEGYVVLTPEQAQR
jgi:hypothetical protein